MQQHTIERDGERPLRFTGELVAADDSHEHSGPASNRWIELRLYRTKAGKFVAQRVGRTCWQGERDRHEAQVCTDQAAAVEFFGFSRTAKRLYDAAGFDVAEHVE